MMNRSASLLVAYTVLLQTELTTLKNVTMTLASGVVLVLVAACSPTTAPEPVQIPNRLICSEGGVTGTFHADSTAWQPSPELAAEIALAPYGFDESRIVAMTKHEFGVKVGDDLVVVVWVIEAAPDRWVATTVRRCAG